MDDFDDLERRLAGRLRPARVPGADETWRRLALQLVDHPARRTVLPTLAVAARVTGAVGLLLMVALLARSTLGRVPPIAMPPYGTGPAAPGAVGASGTSPAEWQPVLLSPRAGQPRVVAVADDPGRREEACGPWDTTVAAPGVRFNSAVCVAFLVAGEGPPTAGDTGVNVASTSVNYGHWGEALAVFALADIPGPPADRLVAVVRIGRRDGGTYAVILDAATGAPYLIVWPG